MPRGDRSCRIAGDFGLACEEDHPVLIGDSLVVDSAVDRVDWDRAKDKLTVDRFDNGRSASALRRSFEQSQHVAFAWLERDVVGMARLLSDGVCNAYLLDVWTQSALRGQGIATAMIEHLATQVPVNTSACKPATLSASTCVSVSVPNRSSSAVSSETG